MEKTTITFNLSDGFSISNLPGWRDESSEHLQNIEIPGFFRSVLRCSEENGGPTLSNLLEKKFSVHFT